MFYVSRGDVPHKRHTQHRSPDGSLYAEELFGVEGFTGRSSLLYHLVPPDADPPHRAGREARLEAHDDGLHRHRLVKTGAVEPHGRRRHWPRGAVLQRRRGDGRGPAGRADAARYASIAMAKPTSCCSSTRAPVAWTPSSGAWSTARATTWCCRSARPGASIPTPRTSTTAADAVPRVRRARSCRPSGTATSGASCWSTAPYSARDIRHPVEDRGARARTGEFVIDVRAGGRITAYQLPAPSLRRRRLGRPPLPVHLQHRGLRADHGARPPAAAGPPDVRRRATTSCARSCRASSTTTRSRSLRPTTTATSTATRSSTTSPATS